MISRELWIEVHALLMEARGALCDVEPLLADQLIAQADALLKKDLLGERA